MYRLGRVWRKKYEGRVKKRCGTTLITEAFAKIKPTDPLRLFIINR
jgi:hypothetical protein